ncbi:hypothetical protein D9M69_373300 [compost metagenome]
MVFSAIHMALNCGNQVFISAGASVPGVIWKTIFTPSTVSSSPVLRMISVGSIRVVVPDEIVWPSPALTLPWALRGSSAPNM